MKKFTTAIGFLLITPLVANVGLEVYVLAKTLFVAGYNDEQMGSLGLAIGAMLFIVTVPLAIAGLVLVRRSRGAPATTPFLAAVLGAIPGLVLWFMVGFGTAVTTSLVITGSLLGAFIGRRRAIRTSESITTA